MMALTMSASAIQAQRTTDPGETLHALFDSVRDELATTEMFISGFYAIVDRLAGEIWYANTGHPHAFVIGGGGEGGGLRAAGPPPRMGGGRPAATRPPRGGARRPLGVFPHRRSRAPPGARRRASET